MALARTTSTGGFTSWRHYVLVVMFVGAGIALGGRVVFLGVTEHEFLQQQGDARSVRKETIPAMRGVITDRNGQALAVSTPVFAIWTDPSRAQFEDADLLRLAEAIDEPFAALRERITGDTRREFVYLKRRATFEMTERLQTLAIDHVYFQPEYRRYYPSAETAAHVVGMTDIDDRGQEGTEFAFDQTLTGRHGSKVVLKDRNGATIRDIDYIAAPSYGRDLSLSIDLNLQFIAYRELKSAVQSHAAKSASLVMLDAQTGEILALVNQPSYNPNDIKGYADGMRNRAVTDAYEPGSTIKPFTAVAAIESGHYNRATPIDTNPGYFRVGNKLIEDPINRNVVSLAQALQKSSQVAFAKIALELDQEAVYDVLLRAGLGEYIGTGLPGETMGLLSNSQLRYPVVRTTFAYGYGLSVTPLQLAKAYLSLATFGEQMPISILKQDRPAPRKRVFDERIAREVLTMMELVTAKEGTASQAAIPGFRVAGKTGTARLVGRDGYDDERHIAWFAGVAPASKPKIVMIVAVIEPSAGLNGGGAVAAPVFHEVAKQSLRLLGVRPDQEIMLAKGSGPEQG
jgi:cell division protein FtsI (penicillin-binding protein 3)